MKKEDILQNNGFYKNANQAFWTNPSMKLVVVDEAVESRSCGQLNKHLMNLTGRKPKVKR